MVDALKRNQLAEELRHFIAGQMTNDEFADRTSAIIKDSKDLALSEIWAAADSLYSDTHEYRLRGRSAIKEDGRHDVARWIAFLYSDLEYEWPRNKIYWGSMFVDLLFWLGVYLAACIFVMLCIGVVFQLTKYLHLPYAGLITASFLFLSMIVSGLMVCHFSDAFANYRFKKAKEQMRRYGNPDIWPFLRVEDFDRIKTQPKFL